MDAERWAAIETIFQKASEKTPEEIPAFLERMCNGDVSLLCDVQALLSGGSEAQRFLESGLAGAVRSILPTMPAPEADRGAFKAIPRFDLLGILGSGGFGTVYKAWDRDTEAMVAIKRFHHADADGLQRFKREFRALAEIAHPNLVALGELFSEEGEWFFTMELLDGVPFRHYVRGQGDRCDYRRLRNGLAQLCCGLTMLHASGKLHLDLKSSNVLVTTSDRVVILDFGLAADTRAMPGGTGLIAGTPAYMAPEQLEGRGFDTSTDWYAAGVMLFEALTGKLPFGGSIGEILVQKRNQAIRVDAFPPDAPADLVEFCGRLMQRDPSLRPSESEILSYLGVVPAAGLESGNLDEPFVGRGQEMQVLKEAFETARSRPVAVYIKGGSGIGKTTLVERFLADVSRQGALLLQGRCYAQESVPYNVLDEVIDSLKDYLASMPARERPAGDRLADLSKLFPVLQSMGRPTAVPDAIDSREVRERAANELRSVLAEIASRQPLVLAIDDLHWGSEDGFWLLNQVLRPPGVPGLLLIATYRGTEADENAALKEMLGAEARWRYGITGTQIELKELDRHDARTLAETVAGGARSGMTDQAETIAAESGGSPLFIVELARSLSASRSSAPLPSFEAAVRSRISRMGTEAEALLRVLAVAGEPLDAVVARRAAHIDLPPRLLSELRISRLIRYKRVGAFQKIEAYHDSISRVVAATMSEEEKRKLHGELAAELEDSGRGSAESLAVHYHAAQEPAQARRYVLIAAEQAEEALAFESAARLYRLALELETDSARARELRLKLAQANCNAGRGVEAARLYLRLAEDADPVAALDLRHAAVWQLLISGEIEEGLALARDVLAAVGVTVVRSPWRAVLACLLLRGWIRVRGTGFQRRDAGSVAPDAFRRCDICWSMVQGLALVNTVEAFPFYAKGFLLALECGEPYRMSRAWSVEAGYQAITGWRHARKVESALAMAASLAAEGGNPHGHAVVTMVTGLAAFLQGRWKTAVNHMFEAEELLQKQRTAATWEISTAHMMGSVSLFLMGRWKVLFERLSRIIAAAEARGDRFESSTVKVRLSHAIYLAQDEPQRAYEEIDAALARWYRDAFDLQHWWALIGRIEVDLYAGDPRAAWDRVATSWRPLRRSLLMRVQYVQIESLHHRARAALALAASGGVAAGERARLMASALADAKRMERENTPWGNALAALLRAAMHRADKAQCVQLLEDAESKLMATDMELFAAAARRIRGLLLTGDAGVGLVASADSFMREQGIRNPAKMTAALAPGFPENRPGPQTC